VDGRRTPILFDETGLRILLDGHWENSSSQPASLFLSTHRWSLDARRGEAVVQ
jgi:hypothetical protein